MRPFLLQTSYIPTISILFLSSQPNLYFFSSNTRNTCLSILSFLFINSIFSQDFHFFHQEYFCICIANAKKRTPCPTGAFNLYLVLFPHLLFILSHDIPLFPCADALLTPAPLFKFFLIYEQVLPSMPESCD